MKKLANKYGGKFQANELDNVDTFGKNYKDAPRSLYQNSPPELWEVNTIVITPEMKEKILKEGVELFGKGGRVGSTLDKPLEGNTREIM